MKSPIWKNTLILAFSAFVVTLTPLGTVRAELVSEEVQEDAISPESALDSEQDDLVIVKKKPVARKASARKMVRREVIEEQEAEPVALQQEPAIEVQTATRTQVALPAEPARKTVGSSIDSSIQTKMDGVREQFEQALVRQLDKIKITVADEQPEAAAPVQTTVVTDSVINAHAAPEKANYMSIESAPVIAEDAADGESVAKKEDAASEKASIRLSPIIGMTSLGSNLYNIENKYTAGIELELAIDDSLAAVLGYSYSQYDISLGNANPFYAAQPQYGYGLGNNYQTLSYNQNVFSGGLRVFLMPRESKLRAFIGGGLGYNKGYLNQNNRYGQYYQYNPYLGSQLDYEVTSWLGILEAGAEFQVSKAVSVGGLFKYSQVLSANENQPLNNYAFINQGYNGQVTDKQIVGGSISKENFYSVLGTVKVAF